MQLEEYRIFVDYISKMIERRSSITTTYLSVNAAIIGVITLVIKDIPLTDWGKQIAALALVIAGLVASSLWRNLIMQYSLQLAWWYKNLRELEEHIQDSSKLFSKEFDELYNPSKNKKVIGITRYETGLTWLFSIGFAGFAIFTIITFIQSSLF